MLKSYIRKLVQMSDPHRKIVIFAILLSILLTASWSLFIPGLGSGHDLNQPARIHEMSLGLSSGQFPVTWSQHLAYGLGMPLFEFYAPLAYYLGASFYLLGCNLLLSTKLVVFVITLTTLLASYFLAKSFFNNHWASILTTSLVVLAPYRAVDIHVRTAFSEALAISFIMLVMLGLTWVAQHKQWGWILLSLSWAGLVLSHNLSTLMAVPFMIIFGLAVGWIFAKSKLNLFKAYLRMFLASLLGLGLSAVYALPALIEKDLTQVRNFTLSSYFNYHQHFLYIRQLFKPWGAWEYGGSGWGPYDELSYFLGFASILTLIVASLLLVKIVFRFKKSRHIETIHLLFLGLVGLSLFMTLTKAEPLWDILPLMSFFQFPWRFMALVLVFIGLLGGSTYMLLNQRLQVIFLSLVLILNTFVNVRYFQNDKYFLFDSIIKQSKPIFLKTVVSEGLYDYIPQSVNLFKKFGFYVRPNYRSKVQLPTQTLFLPEFFVKSQPIIFRNDPELKEFQLKLSNAQVVNLNLAYYPGWRVFSNRKEIKVYPSTEGLISFSLPAGRSYVMVILSDTPIRKVAKWISLVSWLILASLATSELLWRNNNECVKK